MQAGQKGKKSWASCAKTQLKSHFEISFSVSGRCEITSSLETQEGKRNFSPASCLWGAGCICEKETFGCFCCSPPWSLPLSSPILFDQLLLQAFAVKLVVCLPMGFLKSKSEKVLLFGS